MISTMSHAERDVIEELPEYRPLSFAAIAALLLMLPGCLGVFHSGFLIFPLVAIALALFALRKVALSRSGKSEGRVAFAALFLSILVICLTISLHSLNARREYRYAAHCVEHWLRLLRGENPREAHLLSLAFHERPATADEEVRSEIRGHAPLVFESQVDFLKRSEIAALADPGNQIKLTGLASREVNGKRAVYGFAFDLHAPKLTPPDYIAIVEAIRIPGVDGGSYWQIGYCRLIAKNRGLPIR